MDVVKFLEGQLAEARGTEDEHGIVVLEHLIHMAKDVETLKMRVALIEQGHVHA